MGEMSQQCTLEPYRSIWNQDAVILLSRFIKFCMCAASVSGLDCCPLAIHANKSTVVNHLYFGDYSTTYRYVNLYSLYLSLLVSVAT
jgi:hypothetical protein